MPLRRIAVVLLLLLPTTLLAQPDAEAEWEQNRKARERGDVSTYARPVEGSSINQFRGIV